jgi:NADPH2:quinone reductase
MTGIIRAARLHRHGEALQVEQVELARPGEDDVQVELAFSGVNPVDRYMAEGLVAPDGPLPRTLGAEGSGTLEGRPVLIAGGGLGAIRDGLWAQAATVPRALVVDLPEGVELREAAALGIAGLTAWHVVHDLARVTGEDRVLVLGASGGVGSMILSLARAAGAAVWGQTGSDAKAASVQADGAERVIVAGAEELGDAIAEFQPTVVFDPLGDGFLQPVVEAIAPRGRVISFGTSAGPDVKFNLQTLYRKSASLLGYGGMMLSPEERRSGLERALGALQDGTLRVRIDSVLALEEVNEAFERLRQRRVQGKLLLELG